MFIVIRKLSERRLVELRLIKNIFFFVLLDLRISQAYVLVIVDNLSFTLIRTDIDSVPWYVVSFVKCSASSGRNTVNSFELFLFRSVYNVLVNLLVFFFLVIKDVEQVLV